MNNFVQFPYELCRSGTMLSGYKNIYFMQFPRELLSNVALSLTCFNNTDQLNDKIETERQGKKYTNRSRHGVKGALAVFQVLTNVVRRQLLEAKKIDMNYEKIKQEEEAEKKATEESVEKEEEDEEDEEESEVEEDGEESIQDKIYNKIFSNSEEKPKKKKMSIKDWLKERRNQHQQKMMDEDEEEDDYDEIEADNDATSDSYSEHLYMFMDSKLVYIIMPLYTSDLIKDEYIRNEIIEAFDMRKKSDRNKKLNDFLNGMTVREFSVTNTEWSKSMGFCLEDRKRHKIDITTEFPNEMFTFKRFETSLMNWDIETYEEFFTDGREIEDMGLLDNIQNGQVPKQIFIPYVSYKIPLVGFTRDSLSKSLLPWLDDHVIEFFLGNRITDESSLFGKGFTEAMADADQPPPIKRNRDPLDYFCDFNAKLKKQKGETLSDELKKKLLDIQDYVYENPQLTKYYSLSNQALISYFRGNKRLNQGVYSIFGNIPNFDNNEKCSCALSTYLRYSHFEMKNFSCIPDFNIGFVAVTPLTFGCCYLRGYKPRIHYILVGPPGTGKNHAVSQMGRAVPKNVFYEINGASAKANSSDTPQNNGIRVQHEPTMKVVGDPKKLSEAKKEEQNDFKEEISSGSKKRDILELYKTKERTFRFTRRVETAIENVLFFTANECHKDGAIPNRMYLKHYPKRRNRDVIGCVVKKKALGPFWSKTDDLNQLNKDIYAINAKVWMAINNGVIQGPSLGPFAKLIDDIICDLDIEGAKDTGEIRPYYRCLIVMEQLCTVRAILDRYMINTKNSVEVKEFHTHDLVELEKEFYPTTEILLVTLQHLCEQYFDPIRCCVLSTFFRNHFRKINLTKLRTTNEDIKMVNEFVASAKIQVRRYWERHATKRTVRNGSRLHGDREELDFSQSSTEEEEVELQSYRRRKKRKKPLTESEQKAIYYRGPITNIRSYYASLLKIDKMIAEVLRNWAPDQRKHHVYRFKRVFVVGKGACIDFNYASIFINQTRKKIISNLIYRMDKVPMHEDVHKIFKELELPMHRVPIYFFPVKQKAAESIIEMYNPNSLYYDKPKRRLEKLAESFRRSYEPDEVHPLFEWEERYMNEGNGTTGSVVYMHHSILSSGVDPDILINSVKRRVEHKNTKPKRLFSPTSLRDGPDLSYVNIEPNPDVKRLVFDNAAYTPLDIIEKKKKILIHNERRRRYQREQTLQEEEKQQNVQDKDYLFDRKQQGMRYMERENIQNIANEETIIEEDIDIYMRKMRYKELGKPISKFV